MPNNDILELCKRVEKSAPCDVITSVPSGSSSYRSQLLGSTLLLCTSAPLSCKWNNKFQSKKFTKNKPSVFIKYITITANSKM